MSEVIWVALITASAPIGLAILNHFLGRRDRTLAAKTVTEKNRELRRVRSINRRLAAENRRLRLRRPRSRHG